MQYNSEITSENRTRPSFERYDRLILSAKKEIDEMAPVDKRVLVGEDTAMLVYFEGEALLGSSSGTPSIAPTKSDWTGARRLEG